jgi:benzoyl-CoA reductase subunit B
MTTPDVALKAGELRVSTAIHSHENAWFERFREQVIDGQRPYVFSTLLIPRELFEALDLLCLEDMSVVTGLKAPAHYSEVLAEHGFHPGLGGATALGNGLALGVALAARDPQRFCGMPKPALVVSTAGDRAAQIMAAYYGVPYFGIEIPAVSRITPTWWDLSRWHWEDLDESHRIDLVVEQYRAIIAECERITGKQLDVDRLREIVAHVNRQEEYFDEVRNMICAAPKMPFRMGDAEHIVLTIQHNRGTEWSLEQARAFRDEVAARIEQRQWICPGEKLRLMWNGMLLRHDREFFERLETTHGVVFARSLFLSLASDGYIRYGLRDPVRALASRYVTMNQQAHIPPLSTAWVVHEAKRHRIAGALHQLPWEWYDFMSRALEDAQIPVLKLRRHPASWDKEEFRRLVTDFVETRLTSPASGA